MKIKAITLAVLALVTVACTDSPHDEVLAEKAKFRTADVGLPAAIRFDWRQTVLPGPITVRQQWLSAAGVQRYVAVVRRVDNNQLIYRGTVSQPPFGLSAVHVDVFLPAFFENNCTEYDFEVLGLNDRQQVMARRVQRLCVVHNRR